MMKNNITALFKYLFVYIAFIPQAVYAANELPNELKLVGFSLFKGLFGVLLSVIVIYICLVAYKQIKSPYNPIKSKKEHGSLQSSANLDDAIEHFIKDSE